VMPLIKGGQLSDLMNGTPMRLDMVDRITRQICDALDYAHSKGVVHRDIKPSNILVDERLNCLVSDFGIARMTEGTTRLTATGAVVGTPTYMSPEQFASRWLDARSDIYSLGVVLFELLTATRPFVASTPLALAMMHKGEEPPAPRSVRGDLPAWVERVVLRCLHKDPDRRFATAADLALELRRPHPAAVPRRLPSGDLAIEDDPASGGWALELKCAAEKTGWTAAMVLRFYDRDYKLVQVAAPDARDSSWCYRFELLPQAEVIRKLVDYREDCRQRERARQASPWSKLTTRLFH
jgi:serine/threonine protein kinase